MGASRFQKKTQEIRITIINYNSDKTMLIINNAEDVSKINIKHFERMLLYKLVLTSAVNFLPISGPYKLIPLMFRKTLQRRY